MMMEATSEPVAIPLRESEEDVFWENEASFANGFADWHMWRG